MALKNILNNSILQGLSGNLSEQSPESLQQEYSEYLMSGEIINTGFKLIRDVVLITDKRVLFFDKQGATGQKMRVDSVYLFSIVGVSAETAGFGLDDSELTIEYLRNPYLASNNPVFETKKFEFPKKYNVQPLYVMFEEIAYSNRLKING